MRTLTAVLCSLLLCGGCLGPGSSVPEEWVRADRARFEAIAPEYAAYVQADPNLAEASRRNRLDLLTEWDLHVSAVEALLGIVRVAITAGAP